MNYDATLARIDLCYAREIANLRMQRRAALSRQQNEMLREAMRSRENEATLEMQRAAECIANASRFLGAQSPYYWHHYSVVPSLHKVYKGLAAIVSAQQQQDPSSKTRRCLASLVPGSTRIGKKTVSRDEAIEKHALQVSGARAHYVFF